MCPEQKSHNRSKELDVAELEIDIDNVSDPEPSSSRRTTSMTASSSMTIGAMNRSKQEVALTSSGGSNVSAGSQNKNYKKPHYELVNNGDAKGGCAAHPTPSNPRSMSTFRHQNSSDQWYKNNNNNNRSTSIINASNSATPLTKANTIRVHQKSMSNRITSLKRENKTTQTLTIVVGGFIACWLPFFIAYLVTPFLPKDAINEGFSSFLTWLGWFNSAMNPFIYALYSVDFRAAFWRLTCRRFCKVVKRSPDALSPTSIHSGHCGCGHVLRICNGK